MISVTVTLIKSNKNSPEWRAGANRLIGGKTSRTKLREFYVLLTVYPGMILLNKQLKKGKSGSLQAWSGPEGSRKLRFPAFMTTAQDGGKIVSLTHRPPLPQEILLVLISV